MTKVGVSEDGVADENVTHDGLAEPIPQIGRASCRERG